MPTKPPRILHSALILAGIALMPTIQPASAAEDAVTNHKHTNALIDETSPYLLQHAHNPVDWKPWGPAAFEEARQRRVPIFISIGYSTCYWCHVMERESFEDEATAAVMNEHYVCVKIDREERPDVDDIYMAATQTLTGGGGWPMNVFLTPPGAQGEDDPGLQPFYAGTYFPKDDMQGRPSFTRVLMALSNAWMTDREQVLQQSAMLTEAVRDRIASKSDPVRIGNKQIGQAVQQLIQIYDSAEGGFGGAPKFPQPVFIEFLQQVEPTLGDDDQRGVIRDAVAHSLDRMAVGGLFDQVGGGFHRYATDGTWTVPHFEKMLYDNAQLSRIYAASATATGDQFHERIARRTLDYVLNEMTAPSGGFYSAQDAEVNAHEGENYLWRKAEIEAVLNAEDAAFINEMYGLSIQTNFQDPHHRETPPANVLRMSARPDSIAKKMGITTEDLLQRTDAINAALYEARARRDQPGLDDKSIAAWNGLMITAFAEAGGALNEPRYTEAARGAASFILGSMQDNEGALYRTSRLGKVKNAGLFDDYAFVIQGLLALERAGVTEINGTRTIDEAIRLADIAKDRFGDQATGGYFDTPPDRTDLIVRARSVNDGAIPSAMGAMLNNLLDLHELTGIERYKDEAASALATVSQDVAQSPLGAVVATRALHRLLRMDPGAILRAGMVNEVRQAPTESPVKVFANTESVELRPGKPVPVILNLSIAEGFHVNAHEPGVEGLIGLSIDITGGSGVALEVTYPEGVAYTGNAVEDREGDQLMVYENDTLIVIGLHPIEGEQIEGNPRIRVLYQVCDDAACYQPTGTVLGVEITQAP